MCDKCEAEIGVMIDIITKYPDISPPSPHAISGISRTENINIYIDSLNLHSIKDKSSLSSKRILSENDCKVRYLQGLKAGLDRICIISAAFLVQQQKL